MLKKSKIALLMTVGISFTGCATLSAPVREIEPYQAEFYKKKFENSNLQFVINYFGLPGSQGDWGADDFILVYPAGTGKDIPTWKFNMGKKNNRCYIFRFEKNNYNKFHDVTEDECVGLAATPGRVDWDYVKPKTGV